MINSKQFMELSNQIEKMQQEMGVQNDEMDINQILANAGLDLDLKKIEEEMLNPPINKIGRAHV